VTASGVMNRSPAVLGPDDDLASAGQVMLDERLSLLPVVDRSSVVGVLSMTDFVRLAVRVLREDAEAGACRVPVAAVMSSRPLVVARPRDSVSEVEQRMRRERVRHVPVADRDETVVGILSDRDVLAAMRSTTPHWAMKVASVMTPAPVTTTAGADAVAAATSMLRRAVGALPVTEHERLVGMLTKTDFLAYLVTRVTGGRRAHD
ncbi:MAG: CBS domain-containing protein, partial [Deltaproteobacteria bacterium]|nr:CBS domain-containing protein [Deltaproteobacteria bacterium]